jgi:hypothetical protein
MERYWFGTVFRSVNLRGVADYIESVELEQIMLLVLCSRKWGITNNCLSRKATILVVLYTRAEDRSVFTKRENNNTHHRRCVVHWSRLCSLFFVLEKSGNNNALSFPKGLHLGCVIR